MNLKISYHFFNILSLDRSNISLALRETSNDSSEQKSYFTFSVSSMFLIGSFLAISSSATARVALGAAVSTEAFLSCAPLKLSLARVSSLVLTLCR